MLKDKQSTLDHSHSYNVCNKLRIRYGSPKKLYLPLSLQMEKCCSRLEWIGANFVMFACVEFNKTRVLLWVDLLTGIWKMPVKDIPKNIFSTKCMKSPQR